MSSARDLSQVLRAARHIATERGKAAQLAEFAKVSRSRVSEWLSGDAKPDGEAALKLLAWVEGQEAKQNKSPGSASNTARAATRLKVSDETKPKPGRPKK